MDDQQRRQHEGGSGHEEEEEEEARKQDEAETSSAQPATAPENPVHECRFLLQARNNTLVKFVVYETKPVPLPPPFSSRKKSFCFLEGGMHGHHVEEVGVAAVLPGGEQ